MNVYPLTARTSCQHNHTIILEVELGSTSSFLESAHQAGRVPFFSATGYPIQPVPLGTGRDSSQGFQWMQGSVA